MLLAGSQPELGAGQSRQSLSMAVRNQRIAGGMDHQRQCGHAGRHPRWAGADQ